MIHWCINFSASYQLSVSYQLLHFFISILCTVYVSVPQRTIQIRIISSSEYRLRISTSTLLRISYSAHKVRISSLTYHVFRASALVLTFLRISAPGLLRISASARISAFARISVPVLHISASARISVPVLRISDAPLLFCVSAIPHTRSVSALLRISSFLYQLLY